MSDQQNCQHNSAAGDLLTGYAIGAFLAWMFSNRRRPVRDAFFVLTAPVVSMFGTVEALELLPQPDENGDVPVMVSVLVLLLFIAGWSTWASIPATLDVRADQRWWQQAVAAERAYRERYRGTLAEVATAEEMRLFADEQWDAADRSHVDRERWQAVLRRWCARNPTVYPSQDQLRAAGFLCRCDPNRGHYCQRSGQPMNLTQLAREGIPVTPTWLQRVFPSLNYQPHGAAPRLPTEVAWHTRGDRFLRDTSGEPWQPNWRVFWWVIGLSVVFSVVMIAFAILEEQSCGPGGCW